MSVSDEVRPTTEQGENLRRSGLGLLWRPLLVILIVLAAGFLFGGEPSAYAQGCCTTLEMTPPYDYDTVTLSWYFFPSQIGGVHIEPSAGHHLGGSKLSTRVRPGSEISYGCPLSIYICPEFCIWSESEPENAVETLFFYTSGESWSDYLSWTIPHGLDLIDVSINSHETCSEELAYIDVEVMIEPTDDAPRLTPTPPTPDACNDWCEPNDDMMQSCMLDGQGDWVSELCCPEDEDWWTVCLERGQDLEVVLQGEYDGLPGDYDLELYDSDDTLIIGSYHSGSESDEIFMGDADAGCYFLRVVSGDGSCSSDEPYLLSIDISELDIPTETPTPVACNDWCEPNDGILQNCVLDGKGNWASKLCCPEDEDWWAVCMERGQDLEAVLHGEFNGPPGDYNLELYDPDDTLIMGSYHSGTESDEVSWFDTDEGCYFLRVISGDGSCSSDENYVLSVDISEHVIPTEVPTPRPTLDIQEPPPWILVVTRMNSLVNKLEGMTDADVVHLISQRYPGDNEVDILNLDQTGATTASDIDAEIERYVSRMYTEPPRYMLLLGGPAVIPFGEVTNPKLCTSSQQKNCDDDTLYTDDIFGDFDHDQDNIPEARVARLPDGGDRDLFETQFTLPEGRTVQAWGSAMSVANQFRPVAEDIAEFIGAQVQWSLPINVDTGNAPDTGEPIGYFLLHGSDSNTWRWTGEVDRALVVENYYPVAFDRTMTSGTTGTVVTGACYGAYIGTPVNPIPARDSLALSFLKSGAEAFIGSTVINYTAVKEFTYEICDQKEEQCQTFVEEHGARLDHGHQMIHMRIFELISIGDHPLDAYYDAKIEFAGAQGPTQLWDSEEKAFHGYVFFGLPPGR